MTTIDDAWLDRHRVDPATLPDATLIGAGHIEQELRSLLLRLAQPEEATRLGAEVPTAVLLYGPPGTGKTHAARSLARRLGDGIGLFEIGAEELTEDVVHRTFEMLRDRGERALVVIDEIDLASYSREVASDAGRRTLAALLTALDGLVPNTGVLVIGTTSQNIRGLDPAIMRPGRLGFRIETTYPDDDVRSALITSLLADRPVADDVDLARLVSDTDGWSHAEIKATISDAAGLALLDGAAEIGQDHLDRAVGRDGSITPETSTTRPPVNRATLQRVAVHESGHVLCGALLVGIPYLRSLSISRMGGMTICAPAPGEDPILTEHRMRAGLVLGWSGLAAEHVLLETVALGSEDDLRGIVGLARGLVSGGMEPDIAPIDLGEKVKHGQASEEAADRVADLLVAARQRAIALMTEHRGALRRLADRLEELALAGFDADDRPSLVEIDAETLQALVTEILAAEPQLGPDRAHVAVAALG